MSNGRSKKRLILSVLALPTTIVVGIARGLWKSRYALSRCVRCGFCGAEIELVRAWRCATCGFTYNGSVLRACRICKSRPLVVRCLECGLTWRIR